MKIYIEQVIFTNLIIDFCIILMISKLVQAKTKYFRVFLSSFLGSILTLIYPLCPNGLIVNILKILTSIVMLQLIQIKPKQLPLSIMLMFALSYVVGGCILSNFGTQTAGGYMLKPSNLIPVFIVTFISTFVCLKLIKWVKSKIICSSHIYSTTLTHKGNSVSIKSFIDTGNSLLDTDNSPVSLINFETFSSLTSVTLEEYLSNDFSKLNSPHFINASTIAGRKKILVFVIDTLTLNHAKPINYHNVKLGVATNFDNSKEYKAILNSYFCFN